MMRLHKTAILRPKIQYTPIGLGLYSGISIQQIFCLQVTEY